MDIAQLMGALLFFDGLAQFSAFPVRPFTSDKDCNNEWKNFKFMT